MAGIAQPRSRRGSPDSLLHSSTRSPFRAPNRGASRLVLTCGASLMVLLAALVWINSSWISSRTAEHRRDPLARVLTGLYPTDHPTPSCQCAQPTKAAGLPISLVYVPMEQLARAYNTSENSRYYDIGSWRHTKTPESNKLVYQQNGGVTGDMCFFVRAESQGLMLGTERWMLLGGLLPDNATDMAISGDEGRRQLQSLMEEARDLGLNTLRLLAFKDGHTLDHAIQVASGIIDNHAMIEGLDWIVWQARFYGLRLMLVMTSGRQYTAETRGGMAQYIRWHNPRGTAHDFFYDDTYKARYFDWMTALALRENFHTGIQMRYDPTILGWDLGEGMSDPGSKTGDEFQGWIPYMAGFMHKMDPNHLIYIGGDGWFGPASPHHLHINPSSQVRLPWLLTPPGPYPPSNAPTCEGVDFLRNSIPSEIDMASISILPDEWLSCDDGCKMNWAREWLAAHVRDALRMQKPLLISSMYMDGPPSRTLVLQNMVLDYLNAAMRQGMPIAGVFMSLPSMTWCSAPGVRSLSEWNTSLCTNTWRPSSPPSSTQTQSLDKTRHRTNTSSTSLTSLQSTHQDPSQTQSTTSLSPPPHSGHLPPTSHTSSVAVTDKPEPAVTPPAATANPATGQSSPSPTVAMTLLQLITGGRGLNAWQQDVVQPQPTSDNAQPTPQPRRLQGVDGTQMQQQKQQASGAVPSTAHGDAPSAVPHQQYSMGNLRRAFDALARRIWRQQDSPPTATDATTAKVAPETGNPERNLGVQVLPIGVTCCTQPQHTHGLPGTSSSPAADAVPSALYDMTTAVAQQQHCACDSESSELTAALLTATGWSTAQLTTVPIERAWLDAAWHQFMRGDELAACINTQVEQHVKHEIQSKQQVEGSQARSQLDQRLLKDFAAMQESVRKLSTGKG